MFGLGIATAIGGFFGLRAYYEPQLPSVDSLHEIRLGAPLRVYTREHVLIGEFGAERRIPLRYEQIPKPLVQAFVAAEDDRFFSHSGVDLLGLLRASFVLASTGVKRQGGSTITMQLARNVFLSSERTFDRKFKEIFLALKIERELSKQQILELYLNRIFLGNRAYGVGAAAQVYFGKTVDQLSLGEMAQLAGLPKAPSRDNPLASPEHARERRDYVLRRLHELHDIDDKAYRLALAEPLSSEEHPPHVELDAGYVAEMVRAEMYARFGEAAYSDGYEVVTTLSAERQAAANKAVRDAIYDYTERHGYDGPEGHIPDDAAGELGRGADSAPLQSLLEAQSAPGDLIPAVVLAAPGDVLRVRVRDAGIVELPKSAYAWAGFNTRKSLAPGDLIHVRRDTKNAWRLAHLPDVQGAFVALDPRDGGLQALVGGFDFYAGKFNRATQARRQVGSGFKPFLYTAALADGYAPSSIFLDAPVVLAAADDGDEWRPENYEHKFNGPMSLRDALAESRNLVSVRLLQSVGLDYALDFIPKHFGIERDRLPNNFTLALGTADLTPLEMARAYAVIANGGFTVEPYFIQSIARSGEAPSFVAHPAIACPACTADTPPTDGATAAPRVLDPGVDWLIISMMHDVVTRGTGARVRELGRNDLAGKTGTTNDETDAWFNGFQPTLVGISWVGHDQPEPLGRGEVGARAALPIWMDFMRSALKGVPDEPLPRPDDLVDAYVNPATGKRTANGGVLAAFLKDHLPPLDDGHIPGQESGTLTDAIY